jgi:signal transduction histidine kinase
MKRAQVALNDVDTEIEGLLSRTLGPKIHVRSELESELPLVMADESQLEQVVMNLAINARDAMPDGGTVVIETARRTITELETSPVPAGKWVTLSVMDEGLGMDAETAAHVFEPFFTTKGSGAGSGLGLATAHGIITQTGGHITVDSEPGRGTRFTIYLPRTAS